MGRKLQKVIVPLCVWIAVWQMAALAVAQELILPTPLAVLRALAGLSADALFWQSALASLLRVFGGFLLGTLAGVALAALTAAFPWCDWIFTPAVKVIRAVPVVCFILWVLLWRPTNEVPLFIAALMVLPVVWGSTRQGLASADPRLLELAGAYGYGRWRTAMLVYVPSAIPAVAAGCRTALGLAWKAGVAAEVLCLPRLAVGTGVAAARTYLETPELLAWTVAIILLSMVTEALAGLGLKRLARLGEGGEP